MKIPVNKTVKVGSYNGSLKISIPNMVHTITEIKEGDQILYKNIECNDNNEIVITMKIIKGNPPKMKAEVIYITSYNKKRRTTTKRSNK